DPDSFHSLLKGRTIGQARAVGGQIEIDAGEMCLLFNDGTNLRFHDVGDKQPEKHQLFVAFDDGTSLSCSVQMYGGIALYPAGTYDNGYHLVAKEKLSPLTDAFDFTYFMGIASAAKPKLSVKGLLATEQRIPGLGNGCLQDILFRARLNPRTPISRIDDDGWDVLFRSVTDTLHAMTEQGGRNTEKDLLGRPGGYQSVLSSKTYGYGCPVCGSSILRKAYMGGNVYFCPVCQPIPE
ncbi:endonuclease VIII, partial [Ruminococcaceae bacterium OttesenSCG-928-L11]|nr:endonuclease VIII [Ruminococcaceae bacterium OttesenSCG-928-L11]